MQLALLKTAIIGALLALLGGCSAFRLAYSNGSQLAWWWIDGYVDFSREQAPRVKDSLDRWFEWHRVGQLPGYAALLASTQPQITELTSPSAVCRWQQQVRQVLDPALQRALELAAEQLPGLGQEQWRHIEQRFAKNNAEMRSDFLQPEPATRQKAAVKRAVERAESLYGALEAPQLRVITAGVASSPFDAQAWLTEREQRQRELLQTLRRLSTERADRDSVLAALRALVERVERSPDPAYRSYQEKLTTYNCALAALIHNVTTPAQRQVARERLKGWEEDLRSLLAPPVTAAPA